MARTWHIILQLKLSLAILLLHYVVALNFRILNSELIVSMEKKKNYFGKLDYFFLE